MSKAGKGDGVDAGAVGSQHPVPENIPHLSSPVNSNSNNGAGAGVAGAIPKHAHHHHSSIAGPQAGSPIKEGSFLKSETSADEENKADKEEGDKNVPETAASAASEAIPIRG